MKTGDWILRMSILMPLILMHIKKGSVRYEFI